MMRIKLADILIKPLKSQIHHRGLLLGFVRRELQGRFAGTFAGIIWALLNPLAIMLAYLVVFSVIIRMQVTADEVGTNSYWIYFLTGLFPWLIFSEGINKATSVLVNNANLITKVFFPVELLPISTVISSFVINGIGLGILLAYLTMKGYISLSWLGIPLLLFILYIMTTGFSLFLASLCVYLRDVNELIGIVIMLWFFGTPIIYPLSIVPVQYVDLMQINPMYWLIQSYRDIILFGKIDILCTLINIVFACFFYTFGSYFFKKTKNGFADVL